MDHMQPLGPSVAAHEVIMKMEFNNINIMSQKIMNFSFMLWKKESIIAPTDFTVTSKIPQKNVR